MGWAGGGEARSHLWKVCSLSSEDTCSEQFRGMKKSSPSRLDSAPRKVAVAISSLISALQTSTGFAKFGERWATSAGQPLSRSRAAARLRSASMDS